MKLVVLAQQRKIISSQLYDVPKFIEYLDESITDLLNGIIEIL